MQIVSNGDILHKISDPVLMEKLKYLLSVELAERVEWIHFQGKQFWQNCFESLLKRGRP